MLREDQYQIGLGEQLLALVMDDRESDKHWRTICRALRIAEAPSNSLCTRFMTEFSYPTCSAQFAFVLRTSICSQKSRLLNSLSDALCKAPHLNGKVTEIAICNDPRYRRHCNQIIIRLRIPSVIHSGSKDDDILFQW